MTMSITCPQCEKTYRVNADRVGKKARCNGCRHVFVIPEPREVVAVDEPAPAVAVSAVGIAEWEAGPDVDAAEAARFDPWNADLEPSAPRISAQVREREAAPRPQPPAVRETTVAGLALDRMKLTYALQWWGLWAVSVCVAGLVGTYVNPLLALPLALLASWVTLVGTVGGVSHLAVQDVQRGESVHWSEGWGLFARRGLSLVAGCLLLAFVVMITTAFVFGGVFAVSHVPYVGAPLGGLLVIPTFLVILFASVLICNLHLLVVIVGVEDCSAWQALQHLAALVRRDWFALLGWSYLSPFLVTLGTTLFVAVLTLAGLAGALSLCGGEQLLLVLAQGVSLANVLHALSVAGILAGALAFITVFATLQFTLLYCRHA